MNIEEPAQASPRTRDPRLRAALLSALVFPGAGQLAYGQRARGLAFAFGSGVALLALLRRLFSEVLRSLPPDPSLLDLAEIFRLAHEIQGRVVASLSGWFALLAALWLASVWDALRKRR